MTTSNQATPEELIKSFKEQQKKVGEELQQLEIELAKRKELFVKLQGAIEGITILAPETTETEETTEVPEASPEAVTEVLS
tara:strand:+ start:259 stop:501 length:243 start_codon:yes stop_codon:yes gene_type:complete